MANVDQQEIDKFSSLANDWWDNEGPLKTLHDINPTRVAYLQQYADLHDKSVLDVGCGGGILSEAMAKAGAHVTGIDLSASAIAIAKQHAQQGQLSIDYRYQSVDELAQEQPHSFDAVTCLEMLEHVPHPHAVIHACIKLVKPGGDLFISTINRTWQAYLYAIVGAEYLLGIIPLHTHAYDKFIRPSELAAWLRSEKFSIQHMTGLDYNPLNRQSALTDSVKVNYLAHCRRLQ